MLLYSFNFDISLGRTSLIIAASWGDLKVVKLLLEYNADVLAKDNKGK